jgi:hypothetical protein
VTSDGKVVVGNVFAAYNSRGIPLEIIFEALRRKDSIPCWVSFHKDARGCGWKDEKILTTVEQVLRDIGYPQADEVVARLEAYIKHLCSLPDEGRSRTQK